MRPILAVALLAVIAASVWLRSEERPEERIPVSVAEIAASPETFMGRRLVVSGQVTDIIGRASSLEEGSPRAAGFSLGAGGGVLVVGVDLLDMSGLRGLDGIEEGEVVQVAGRLRRFTEAELGDEVGVLLGDALYDAWSGAPAILASKITVVPVRLAGRLPTLSVPDLSRRARWLDGDRVRLEDAVVTAGLPTGAAALGDDVLLATTAPLVAGDRVDVVGKVVRLPSAVAMGQTGTKRTRSLAREYGIEHHLLRRYDVVVVPERLTRSGG